MNVVEAELSHLYFLYNNIEDINTTIDNADVSIRRGKNDRRLYVEIRGKKENHLRKLFFEIHSLMFLYLGGFPKIEKIIINSKIVDTSQLVAKFNTCKEYYKEGLSLCDINNKTINKTVIQNYRKLRQYPIYTLQNLVSEQYASVVMVHKVTLLLHAMEGVMDSDLLDKTHNELKAKWNTKKSIREIKVASYYMCKNYFFNYHRKYKFDILKLLKVSRKRFLDIIADTRDWYSHYLEDLRRTG